MSLQSTVPSVFTSAAHGGVVLVNALIAPCKSSPLIRPSSLKSPGVHGVVQVVGGAGTGRVEYCCQFATNPGQSLQLTTRLLSKSARLQLGGSAGWLRHATKRL